MTTSPWSFTGEAAGNGTKADTVTLVEGSSFCLSARTGDIEAGTTHGLFFLDTRFLSGLTVRVDGARLEPLTVAVDDPFAAAFLTRTPLQPGSEGTIAVIRRRSVGDGLVERIVLRSYDRATRPVEISVALEVDFADLFAVKERRARRSAAACDTDSRHHLVFESGSDPLRQTVVRFSPPAAETAPGRAVWRTELAPRAEWELCIEVTGEVAGRPVPSRYSCAQPAEQSQPARQMQAWRASMPVIDTDDTRLTDALRQTAEDLGALRLLDPDHPDDIVVAAGAPWFMTLFGRDSLITSYMALIVEPEIALGVLRTLARFQGREANAETEEQPGRILHELRFHDRPSRSFRDGTRYYGSVDATPLFVIMLGELRRWGLAPEVVNELLVNADRALDWIARDGDRDGDGYVEYERQTPAGLANQGWKDSWDGVTFADGRLPTGPIALCEVQGYVYAAYLARAYFAEEQDDPDLAHAYRERAAALKQAFNRDFWLEDRGHFAIGLDGDKRPIDALASNMGHCLWTGIVDEDKAEPVARHLMSPEMFSGWGVRTLATSMQAYNPLSYHNGSVWPHDNAIIAAGLMRYGFVDEAHRIITAMLDVSTFADGRLPELFAGVDRAELSVPAIYPTSCIPQAWAAASPLLFLRTLLRFDPWIPRHKLWVAPRLPATMRRLNVARIPLGGERLAVQSAGDDTQVSGLGAGIELVLEPRFPLTETLGGRDAPPSAD